jgi:hypothetical protein
MALQVSLPVRIAAICGLAVTVIAGFGLRMVGGGAESVATPHIIRHHPFGPGAKQGAGVAPKVTHSAKPAAKPAAKPKTHVAKAKAARVHPKPSVDRVAITAARAAGLPAPLAQAFGRYKIVVVSLYDPYSQVDGIAFAEARAGAGLAGVGFVPLNVLSQPQVGKLTEKLGLLPDPGVLVYVRPGTLAAKISGFADKETVAQAAANAAHKP